MLSWGLVRSGIRDAARSRAAESSLTHDSRGRDERFAASNHDVRGFHATASAISGTWHAAIARS
jgi:hypothetical protein